MPRDSVLADWPIKEDNGSVVTLGEFLFAKHGFSLSSLKWLQDTDIFLNYYNYLIYIYLKEH